MRDFAGKVAVVTGAASGIGLGLATRFAQEGMKVVMADIEEPVLNASVTRLRQQEYDVLGVVTDVSSGASVEALRDKALEAYGKVHIVCNNAGVGGRGASDVIWGATEKDWQWALGVNLWGVIHGVRAFVPRLVAQGEGHVVNTASVAGLISPPGMGVYNVTKHAVVALSESLHHDLRVQGSPVGVSVLCPAYVPTGIADSERNRPAGLANPAEKSTPQKENLRKAVASGKLSADDVARAVVAAVKEERFYILTHPRIKGAIRSRMEDVLEERTPRNPLAL